MQFRMQSERMWWNPRYAAVRDAGLVLDLIKLEGLEYRIVPPAVMTAHCEFFRDPQDVGVRALAFDGVRVDAASAAALCRAKSGFARASLKQVRTLRLLSTTVDAEALKELTRLAKVSTLDLSGSAVSNDAWAVLDAFPKLEKLVVRGVTLDGTARSWLDAHHDRLTIVK